MLQATLLIALLSIPLLAMAAPSVTVWAVHPASIAMLVIYGLGLRWTARHGDKEAWKPFETPETVPDEENREGDSRSLARLWITFALCACGVAGAGYLVAESGMEIADRTGFSQSAVGAVFTGVVTSSGELVTSIAAVRRGALTLAVGGIIGGNTFDSLLISVSDFAYRDGSLYHSVGDQPAFLAAATVLMSAVLLMGLLIREKHGPANIGFESALVLLIYAGTVAVVFAV